MTTKDAKESVKNIRNYVLECQEHVRKLPDSPKGWDALTKKLRPAAAMLQRMSERHSRVWWQLWTDDEVSRLYVDLICTVLDKVQQVQLANIPGLRRAEVLESVLLGFGSTVYALCLGSTALGTYAQQTWPYLLSKLDSTLLASVCEATSHAGQMFELMETPGAAVLAAWHQTVCATGYFSMEMRTKMSQNQEDLQSMMAKPACVAAHNLIAQHTMQYVRQKPSVLRNLPCKPGVPTDD
eukprot:CAMPEP_0202914718 /NCGR_PEP_ID=MMETSP1392-20130828/63781_1 /ASSEMBLY_ACC=CAM_ASM_000868 /TAXON_ID=225041 /ORGANISM="Chlamydomonas chlamydogama, Strain SAG 11-48b" /LENGTH=238 /DNA_ID=CAMNT_0049606473 /DNA_START=93 /DNA_END=806 /DNA_ORIENTATION=-